MQVIFVSTANAATVSHPRLLIKIEDDATFALKQSHVTITAGY